MEPIILNVAIDSFAIQAERLRCPKLAGRPVALAPADSARPRVVLASREALAHGVTPGVPLVVARRMCRDLIALPPDADLYAGLSDSIRDRLLPWAPMEPAARPGRFVLDLTGVTRTHGDACDRAARAGRDLEREFGLHPTLGVAATRLVSRIAAGVLAPDGELLDVPAGSESAFLAPLSVRVLPTARGRSESPRLDLLALRHVRDVQALEMLQLEAAVGPASALSLWREARGLDGVPERAAARPPTAVAEETLASETNDLRVLAAHMERLSVEVGFGIRRRGTVAARVEAGATYADGRQARARRAWPDGVRDERAWRAVAVELLDRALTRRVRVRRIRLAAWEDPRRADKLALWGASDASEADRSPSGGQAASRAVAFESALDRLRLRLGTAAVVPASWMALGVALRPSARP
jgi:DNA polymerase-4